MQPESRSELPLPLVSRIVVELLQLFLHLRVIFLQHRECLPYALETHLLIPFFVRPRRILHPSEVLDLLTAVSDLDQTYGGRRTLEKMSKRVQLGEITLCSVRR